MKKTIFEGMATAIVTPMTADGIDYGALGRFIDFQIESGINAIVVMGTTGENATIEYADQKEIIRYTVERVNHRVPVIAGTGTNNTDHVLHNTRNACEVGADAILVVTPYYNKATQNGLYQHFKTIADASDVPVILYNVPGRTGCGLQPKTIAKLAEHPNIVALKEATGNMAQMVDNVKTFENPRPLNETEQDVLRAIAAELANSVPCTACRYCCDGCPQGLDIPSLLAFYNDLKVAPSFLLSMRVEALPPEKRPTACIGCGACAAICPQNIDIPAALSDMVRILGTLPSWEAVCREREEAAKRGK